MPDDDKKQEPKKVAEELKGIVEDMDTLSDEVGFGFWDGADVVLWIVAAIIAIIGIIASLETGGVSLLVSLLALIIVALDIIAKLAASARTDSAKKKADDLEKRIRELERRVRNQAPSGQ